MLRKGKKLLNRKLGENMKLTVMAQIYRNKILELPKLRQDPEFKASLGNH